ncbi:MAG: isochorismatase family protein [Phycisphaerae bacterium]|nr:isochorismatase family protein [Phycisphaerae bacterium]
MTHSNRRSVFERVILDLNTQCDFLLPGGALPVANRADVLPRVRQLMNWARLSKIPVISSLEAHRPGESFRNLPPHCLDHTLGQKKLPFTLMPNRMLIMGDNTADVPMQPFTRFQQLIFTKRNADFLANPKADRLINTIEPEYWIIFGITATHCVKHVTLGLLARHHKVVVVRDACGYWSAVDGEHAFRQMEAKGAILATTGELTDGSVAEAIRAHKLQVDAEEESDANEAGLESNPGKTTAGANGRRNGAKSGVPKSGAGRQSDLHPEDVADFVPQHLVRRRARAAGRKPGRGLA